jgi:membrane protease YdiL (CAAX protease family)
LSSGGGGFYCCRQVLKDKGLSKRGQAMVMVTSEIPALWWWGVAVVWTVAAFFLAFKGGWLSLPDRSEAFPFSARQFFLMVIALFFAFALYIASFVASRSLVLAFQKIPISMSIGGLAKSEWLAIEQIIGLVLGTIAVSFITAFLPADLLPIVTGKSEGVKKWFKGTVLGFLFVPVILLATGVIGLIVSIVSPETRAPQVALEVLTNLRGTSVVFWLLLVSIVCIVPCVEEMLFRGFLQGFLNGLVHPTLSLLLTAAAFSFFHYSPLQKSSNFEIMIGLFVFSILSSKIRVKEDSINASIGMHAAFNATSLCLFFGLS